MNGWPSTSAFGAVIMLTSTIAGDSSVNQRAMFRRAGVSSATLAHRFQVVDGVNSPSGETKIKQPITAGLYLENPSLHPVEGVRRGADCRHSPRASKSYVDANSRPSAGGKANMAKNEKTSKKVAAQASKMLSDPKTSKAGKSVAASALTQRPDNKKKGK